MKKILFVCTGNTCRSPMAAALFNRRAALEPAGHEYTADSAGVFAYDGAPPSSYSVLALNEYPGGDLSGHRSRTFSKTDADEACLILTMEQKHKQHILSMYPDANQKVYTLKEYVYGDSGDIKDPYPGGTLQHYSLCAEEIAEAVGKLMEKLK